MRAILFACCLCLPLSAQTDLTAWLNAKAMQQLDQREAAIRKIRTTAEAQQRQSYVRAKVLELIGGLPDYNGPLNARVTGVLAREAYIIESVVFESLPNYLVTGNIYRPKAAGRYPAVLLPLGHWDSGKAATQRIAANLALKGFVVLAYDPMGQGERLQGYDRRLGNSITPGGTTQHFMAGGQSILMGESFARYRIWDAKRALDYLLSRPDVDAQRVGCTGCSGGGTVATYISALDSRIKVAAPSCYMNSFRVLFGGSIGDSEQTIPGFLASGLDQTDFVELFAPKPWLIGSTREDFFTPAGARLVYEESREWYRLFGAEEKIRWVLGPGPHGTPVEVREAIYEWMIRWLKDGKGSAKEQDVEIHSEHALWATKYGQVALEGSRDLYEYIRDRKTGPADLPAYLRGLIGARPATPPVAKINGQKVTFETEPGLEISGRLYLPSGPGPHSAVLLLETGTQNSAVATRIAESGRLVLALTPRGLPYKADPARQLGDWMSASRAWLIGGNLTAMRAGDILRGVDYLASRNDVKEISATASDTAGIWLLMAAAVDPRISRVWLNRTPHSFRSALDNPAQRNLHDALLPGFALHWDIPDLVKAIAPRRVTWTDPTDWMRNVVPLPGDFRYTIFDKPEPDLP